MTAIQFEWDESKNLSNQRKHGISFRQASQVFLDPLHIVTLDRVVDDEQRWQAKGLVHGLSGGVLLIVVAHTWWEELESGISVEVVRIISARPATPEERTTYEEDR